MLSDIIRLKIQNEGFSVLKQNFHDIFSFLRIPAIFNFIHLFLNWPRIKPVNIYGNAQLNITHFFV